MSDSEPTKPADLAVRDSEERLRLALDTARVGLAAWDVAADRVEFSEGLYRILGRPAEAVHPTFDGFFECVHVDDRARVRAAIESALATTTADLAIDYRITWPDGSIHWVTSRAKIFYDDGGTPLRIVGAVMDITSLKDTEEKLHQAQKVEAIGRLAGGVAHDFNNLLTAIVGHTEIALASLQPDPPGSAAPLDVVREHLEEIRRASERAVLLTRQLLAFGRRQRLAPQALNVNTLVHGLERMLTTLVGEAIELRLLLSPELGTVAADPHQIERVIINLVVNARDAMPDGGRLVIATTTVVVDEDRARMHEGMAPGSYARLAVTDTGHGMDAATLAQVFDPFFTTKAIGKGTGLGLSTAYGIIRQSGGHISVASAIGEGTTVDVYLPVVASDAVEERERGDGFEEDEARHAQAAEPAEAGARAPNPQPPPVGRETVLLVEDEPQVRSLARRALEHYGYRVLEAGSGSEALALYARHGGDVDLLLTDVVMPQMGGHELGRRLREQAPSMKIVFMSGYADDVRAAGGEEHTGDLFVEKPFAPDTLVRAVRHRLDAKSGA